MLCTDISMLALSQGGLAAAGDIPADPRDWTRQDVYSWLSHSAIKYQINTHPERFPMNGKALVLLTRDMFCERVPEGGGLVFEEFQLKLQRAVGEQMRKIQEVDSLLRAGLLNH